MQVNEPRDLLDLLRIDDNCFFPRFRGDQRRMFDVQSKPTKHISLKPSRALPPPPNSSESALDVHSEPLRPETMQSLKADEPSKPQSHDTAKTVEMQGAGGEFDIDVSLLN